MRLWLSGIMRLHEAAIPRRIHVISGSVRSAVTCVPLPTFFDERGSLQEIALATFYFRSVIV